MKTVFDRNLRSRMLLMPRQPVRQSAALALAAATAAWLFRCAAASARYGVWVAAWSIATACTLNGAVETEKTLDAENSITPELLERLTAELQSKDWDTQTKALRSVQALIEVHHPSAFKPLVVSLFSKVGWGDRARENSVLAVDLLVRMGSVGVPLLLEKLKSDEAHDRWSAIMVLARIGEPTAPVVASVRPLVADEDAYVRRIAIEMPTDFLPMAASTA